MPAAPAASKASKKAHTNKERYEYARLEGEMDALAKTAAALEAKLAAEQASLGYTELAELTAELTEATEALDEKELRWMELAEKLEVAEAPG